MDLLPEIILIVEVENQSEEKKEFLEEGSRQLKKELKMVIKKNLCDFIEIEKVSQIYL